MKKCEKVIKINRDNIKRFEIEPYETGGVRVSLFESANVGSDIISFDITDHTELISFMNYIANYSTMYIVVLTDGSSKFRTSYTSVEEYLRTE